MELFNAPSVKMDLNYWKTWLNMQIMYMILEYTGKSLLEALILASTNPQYDKILFID